MNTDLSCCCRCSVMSDSATPWNAACQASLSFTISQSLLRLMSIESVKPSNHLILCWPLLFMPSYQLVKSLQPYEIGIIIIPILTIEHWDPGRYFTTIPRLVKTRTWRGTPLVVQWLRICNIGDVGSIPGRETKIPHSTGQQSPRATTKDPVCCN